MHAAADGPLARVRLPGGLIRAAQLRVLADCAATLGSGIIELTSRGNAQVRGLTGAPAPAASGAPGDAPGAATAPAAGSALTSAVPAAAEAVPAEGTPTAAGSAPTSGTSAAPDAAHPRATPVVPGTSSVSAGPVSAHPGSAAASAAPDAAAEPAALAVPGTGSTTADVAPDSGAASATALFAERIAAVGLLPSVTHERVRNIVASPFGPLGERGLVDALDRRLCARPELARLPGRFLFSVGDIGLDADVTYVDGRLLLAGWDAGIDVPPEAAVARMLDAAEAFLRLRTTEWRIAELEDGPARIATLLGGSAGERRPSLPQPRRLGVHRLADGGCAVQALVPLGRLTPEQAFALAGLADEVRVTPWRTVVIRDVADPGEVRRRLEAAGLVTDPDSPWQGVTACSGRPGCAKSHTDVRADATAWVLARHTAPDIPVHWSGCERRCGLPRGRVRQMVATPSGYLEGIS